MVKANSRQFVRLFIYTFVLLQFTACEIGNRRKNTRTPHMPVFADVEENAESKSNPYWSRFTAYQDKTEINLSNGKVHQADQPALLGSLGTFYRWPSNNYLYLMTDGWGGQHDWFINSKAKVSLGFFLGYYQQKGAQLIYTHQLGSIYNGKVNGYFSIQRQELEHNIVCLSDEKNQCAPGETTASNSIWLEEDALNTIIGFEFGRFRMGDKGNTTLNFTLELGYQNLLSTKLLREDYLSNYKRSTAYPFFSINTDLTLW